MALKLSTGLRNAMLDSSSLKGAMDGSVIRLYAGNEPSTADAALDSATLLCEVSVNGDGTGVTLAASAQNAAITKNPNESWFGEVLTSGTATFFRMVIPANDDGTLSTTQQRIQGTVAAAGGDAYIANPSIVQGESQSLDYLTFALPSA